MIKIIESFKEFIDTARISQGSSAFSIYGSNPNVLSNFEKVSFPELGINSIRAKIDSGADGTSIHANDIKEKNGVLSFWINSSDTILEFKKFKKITVKNSFGSKKKRYQITTLIKFDNFEAKIKVSLTSRENMKFPCILGKNFIKSGKFIIDLN